MVRVDGDAPIMTPFLSTASITLQQKTMGFHDPINAFVGHWFSNLYASIDAMQPDEFAAGLAPDVKVVVGNHRALDRKSLVSTHASNMRKSIIGHEHHPIRRLLASRMGFPVGTGDR
jgi:hypothetical protein